MNHLVRVVTFGVVAPLSTLLAHQPIMDMAPRWAGGYGLQFRQVWYGSDELLVGASNLANPQGLERYARQTWLEGVYTFNRAIRLTAKLPYLNKERTVFSGGVLVEQEASGLGDLILAAPLRKYRNLTRYTDNFGLTPQLRLPTGDADGAYAVSDGSWDLGLSLSYSGEGFLFERLPNLNFYQLYDLFHWENRKGKDSLEEGDLWGLDVNLGVKLYDDADSLTGAFLMWDLSWRRQEAGDARTGAYAGESIHTGPVLVWYRENLMARAEWKFSAQERRFTEGIPKGDIFELGVGFSF